MMEYAFSQETPKDICDQTRSMRVKMVTQLEATYHEANNITNVDGKYNTEVNFELLLNI